MIPKLEMVLLAPLLLLAATTGFQVPPADEAAPIAVTIDWASNPKIETSTAATIEVDVMPFLARTRNGGPFNAYFEALQNLGSEYVRFAPWFPNPRAVVTELRPPDCTVLRPATNWNSTALDGVVRDFMEAVCGLEAHAGSCTHSVIQQLSTMPSWMYVGGFCPDGSPSCLPEDPWDTPIPFGLYEAGTQLVDPSCGQMARYFGRLVGWYTAGGFNDECGHWHASGLHYAWHGLSVLNEDEHGHFIDGRFIDDGTAYTTVSARASKRWLHC